MAINFLRCSLKMLIIWNKYRNKKYLKKKKKPQKLVYCKKYLQCCGFCKSREIFLHTWELVYFIGIKLISISVQDLKQLICYTNCFVRIVVFTCIMSRFFFIIEILRFFLFQLYICATNTKGISFFFWHLEHKINIRSHILKNVDILNNKMRLSLYIVHQSNIIVVGFFFLYSYV